MPTATLAPDGRYDLSEPIVPYTDDMTFARIAIYARSEPELRGTWALGVGQNGLEHPAPLLQTPLVLTPALALSVLGYTLTEAAG